MKNENGYVIYPSNMGFMDLEAAKDAARLDSTTGPDYEARVEDCDTEKTLAKYRRGKVVFEVA